MNIPVLNLGNKNVDQCPWPCSCACVADFEQVCICWNTDSYSNLSCFMLQLVFNLQFDTCSVHFSFVFLEILSAIAVLERYIRKRLFEWNLNFWSRQDYPLEILVLSKYSFIRIYFKSGDIRMKIVYASVRCGFRIPATSEVKMFLRIVNSFQLLTFVTRTLF